MVKKYDEQKIPPSVDVLKELFLDRPVLLLIDEFYNYVTDAQTPVGNKTLGELSINFIIDVNRRASHLSARS